MSIVLLVALKIEPNFWWMLSMIFVYMWTSIQSNKFSTILIEAVVSVLICICVNVSKCWRYFVLWMKPCVQFAHAPFYLRSISKPYIFSTIISFVLIFLSGSKNSSSQYFVFYEVCNFIFFTPVQIGTVVRYNIGRLSLATGTYTAKREADGQEPTGDSSAANKTWGRGR